MRKRIYVWTRELHLYLGLFVSPFVLVFAATVFFLNHARAPVGQSSSEPVQFTGLKIPAEIEEPDPRARLPHVRAVLDQMGVTGEIDYIRQVRSEGRLVIPVTKPGLETTVDLSVAERSATVTSQPTGFWSALVYLHKRPGPHNANIRGNWVWTNVWRGFGDATVYLLLFLSLSGVYLWAVLRSERRIGLVLIAAGALSCGGLIYGLL